MEPRPHNPILTQNNSILIELYGPPSIKAMNQLRLGLHTFLYSSSGNYKQPVTTNL